jgi:hypothetical protein
MSEEKKDIHESEEIALAEEKEQKEEKKPALPPHKEYAKRMIDFGNFYIGFLALIVAAMAAAVAVAILYNVMLGVSMAIFGVIIYAAMVPDNMSKNLGVRYESIVGGIKLTSCRPRYGEVMWVPDRLMWFDVIAIGDKAFSSKKNAELKKVFLPNTLKEIGEDVFSGCSALEDIYYQGSEDEWSKISSATDMSGYRLIFNAKYPPLPKKRKKTVSTEKK